jgi:hypothetical protein
MIHLLHYIVMTIFGIVLLILDLGIWYSVFGFVLVMYSTFETIFHLTVDEHVRW